MLKKLFLHRGARCYIQLAAGLIAIVSAIIFFALDRAAIAEGVQFGDFSERTMIFMIAGGVVSIFDALFPLPFVGIGSSVLYGVAIGCHFYIVSFPFADTIQPVAFFSKTLAKAQELISIFLPFAIIFVLVALLSIVANFLTAKKTSE